MAQQNNLRKCPKMTPGWKVLEKESDIRHEGFRFAANGTSKNKKYKSVYLFNILNNL